MYMHLVGLHVCKEGEDYCCFEAGPFFSLSYVAALGDTRVLKEEN